MTHTETLRHQAFFDRLGTMKETDSGWPAIAAGLVVLRQLDSRIVHGAERDAWQVAAARESVSRIGGSNAIRLLLTRILELADSEEAPAVAAVGPRLLAYGRALETEAEWALAADVYTCVADIVPADVDMELVADAMSRLAFVARMRADWDAADDSIRRASALAGRLGDAHRLLGLRMASANVAMNRGDLVRAEDILSETLALSVFVGGEIHSEALHARGELDYDRGDAPGALGWFERALDSSPSEIGRERLLLNIAAASLDMGSRSVARDALLVLAVTAQTSNTRWLAVVNLLEVATLDRNEIAFEQYRRDLGSSALPPRTAAYFAIYEGHGFRAFGRRDQARASYARAGALAVAHGFARIARDANSALDDLESNVSVLRPQAELALPASLVALAARVRGMREEAVGAA